MDGRCSICGERNPEDCRCKYEQQARVQVWPLTGGNTVEIRSTGALKKADYDLLEEYVRVAKKTAEDRAVERTHLTSAEKSALDTLRLNIDKIKDMLKTYPVIFEYPGHHSVFTSAAQVDAVIAEMEAVEREGP